MSRKKSQAEIFDLLSFATSVRGKSDKQSKRRRIANDVDVDDAQHADDDEQPIVDAVIAKQPKQSQFKRNVTGRIKSTNTIVDDAPIAPIIPATAESLRARHHIKIYHDLADIDDTDNNTNDNDNNNDFNFQNVPDPIDSFDSMAQQFQWPAWLVRNLAAFQFSAPTPIQMQAIPIMMADQDLLAYSATGSGKTLAFMLPILARLREPLRAGARAVVLCPTRELAQQIFAVILRLTKGTVVADALCAQGDEHAQFSQDCAAFRSACRNAVSSRRACRQGLLARRRRARRAGRGRSSLRHGRQ
jgi:hypothetical protein